MLGCCCTSLVKFGPHCFRILPGKAAKQELCSSEVWWPSRNDCATSTKLPRSKSRTPLGRFSLNSLKCKRAKKLKAKAGQARCLVPFTAALAREFRACDGSLGEHSCAAMATLAELFALAKPALTSKDMSQWRLLAAVHMYHYARCGFSVYPKFRYFLHMPEQVERGGLPQVFWVYSDESKNREAKHVWKACSKGWSLCQQVLLRLQWLDVLQALEA